MKHFALFRFPKTNMYRFLPAANVSIFLQVALKEEVSGQHLDLQRRPPKLLMPLDQTLKKQNENENDNDNREM